MAIVNQDITLGEFKSKKRRIMGVGGPDDDQDWNSWPPWLKPLLRERFFGQCKAHPDSHKSECNMYCLDCMNGSLCSLCLSHHRDHHSIQIRRSSYHDVIRVSEIQNVLDITGVQTYIINSARVVFLNERPQPRPGKGVTNTCGVCERSLLDTFRFCSLGCKTVGTSKNFVMKKRQISSMAASESEDSYSGNSNSNSGISGHGQRQHKSINTHNSNKKKVQSFTPTTPPLKRRKGIPHRAPMGGLMIEY
ncbi:hypothetical protein MLD38_038970 [Melastoma candidum]|uniref:Uncharacterized protein n=1 Tax=Melastoma candidum TaxID=119954 RepID=A0ACB9L1D0_9MYRT|nr:hypothetical protein MLD38_038970 [Melastoma candidum]